MAIQTCVITGYGINADVELATAFRMAGSEASSVHISDILEKPAILAKFDILAFPGGFSFGDHLGSGKVLANLCKKGLRPELDSFVKNGKLLIGICNGFQVLVKMGILPNIDGEWTQSVSLIHNEKGRFEDSWVKVSFEPESPCLWTKGLKPLDMPIRHGEGRFITASPDLYRAIKEQSLIAIRYDGRNPNGSEQGIAGITDPTGRILGMMPHPEAFLFPENHPHRRLVDAPKRTGLELFRKAVETLEHGK